MFNIMILKPISHFSEKNRRKKLLKKGGLLRLSADLAFIISRTKDMQNKNGLNISRIALQRNAPRKVDTTSGPHPSDISDLMQCTHFDVQKGSKNSQNLSREIIPNGSHSDYLPFISISIPIREQKRQRLSPLKSSFDLGR